jgi:hypothetical protein
LPCGRYTVRPLEFLVAAPTERERERKREEKEAGRARALTTRGKAGSDDDNDDDDADPCRMEPVRARRPRKYQIPLFK